MLSRLDHTLLTPKISDDYFVSLCEDIIGQQLGGKAADAITKRFHELLGKHGVCPESVLESLMMLFAQSVHPGRKSDL